MSAEGFGPTIDSDAGAHDAPPADPVGLNSSFSLSLDALFRAQTPVLMRFLTRRTVAHDDAMDLIQESFLRMVRVAQRSAAPLNPEAYLQRIVRNLMRDRASQAIRRSDVLHSPPDEETLPANEPDPEATLRTKQLIARYHAALLGLSPKTRNVFLRHRRDGLTYGEIAKELNQTVSNVEKHMMRAIAHLDRVLGRPE